MYKVVIDFCFDNLLCSPYLIYLQFMYHLSKEVSRASFVSCITIEPRPRQNISILRVLFVVQRYSNLGLFLAPSWLSDIQKKWHILGKGELFQTFKSRKQTFCVWRLRLGHRHRSTHLNRNGNIYIFPLRILYLFILHHTSLYQTKLLKPDNPSSIIIDG